MAKKLTNAWVAKLLRAKGLKGSPEDLKELTRMRNEDLEREAQEAEKAAARETEDGRADTPPSLKLRVTVLSGWKAQPPEQGRRDSSLYVWI